MKTNLALIGMVALALGACDKKEEVSQTATQPKQKASGPNRRPSSSKPAASKPKPAIEPEIAQTPAEEPSEIQSSPSAPALAHETPPAPAMPSASGKTTDQLREERLARMAKAREERVAETTAQITTRFKEQDTNNDGFLAKEEVNGRMQRRFTEADKNNDGFLDATEQQTMIQATAQRMSEGGGQRRGGQDGGADQGRGNRNP